MKLFWKIINSGLFWAIVLLLTFYVGSNPESRHDPEISRAKYQLLNIQAITYSSAFQKYVISFFSDDEMITESEFKKIEDVYERIRRVDSMPLYLQQKAYKEKLDDGD